MVHFKEIYFFTPSEMQRKFMKFIMIFFRVCRKKKLKYDTTPKGWFCEITMLIST